MDAVLSACPSLLAIVDVGDSPIARGYHVPMTPAHTTGISNRQKFLSLDVLLTLGFAMPGSGTYRKTKTG
jgi:hypothetical protein